jgi:hypothetical protein
MGCAPLDAWARLLFAPPARIPWRYWPRLLVALAVSALITALTLPERLVLAPILFVCGRATRHRLRHPRGVIIVLGYYRSGTTHLHNLLACDRRSQTPRWFEALVPQGFVLSWNFLRLFLLGFLSTKRPQDDMAFGPEWPAEDDFALNNWCVASSLAGRVALPQRYAFYQRFHFLDGLTDGELARWRRYEWAFLAKLRFFAFGRRLLLKTPSHTARVARLIELFGAGNVKFVHVSRAAGDVVRSNVAMLQRMSMYNQQDAPSEREFIDIIVDEYDRTERKFLAEKALIRDGSLVSVRFEDLTADPIAELKRIYSGLALPWEERYERAVERYLDSVREYRPASQKKERPAEDPVAVAARQRLGWMHAAFAHDSPAREKVEPPLVGFSPEALRRRARRAWATLPLFAIGAATVWLGVAIALDNRSDWMVWLSGVVIGIAAQRIARVGTVGLGVWAATMTVAALWAVAFPATRLIYYKNNPHPSAFDMWDATWKELRSEATLPWVVFGVLTAYKLASRRSGTVPGK